MYTVRYLKFVPTCAAIVTLRTFKRFVLQVDPLVTHQVTLLDERATTDAAYVTEITEKKCLKAAVKMSLNTGV